VSSDGVIEAEVPDDEFTIWCFSLANTVDEVEGRPPLRSEDFRTVVDIAAPVDEVFESLVDPKLFERWFGLPLEIEPYVGGRWSILGGGPTGTVAEVVANQRLALLEDTGTSTWSVSEVNSGTRLTVSMRGPDGGPPPELSWHGWLSAITQLRRLHEVPDRCPIWVL
jgi:uncharacterized protein YndB with AHSA1/START domain